MYISMAARQTLSGIILLHDNSAAAAAAVVVYKAVVICSNSIKGEAALEERAKRLERKLGITVSRDEKDMSLIESMMEMEKKTDPDYYYVIYGGSQTMFLRVLLWAMFFYTTVILICNL